MQMVSWANTNTCSLACTKKDLSRTYPCEWLGDQSGNLLAQVTLVWVVSYCFYEPCSLYSGIFPLAILPILAFPVKVKLHSIHVLKCQTRYTLQQSIHMFSFSSVVRLHLSTYFVRNVIFSAIKISTVVLMSFSLSVSATMSIDHFAG